VDRWGGPHGLRLSLLINSGLESLCGNTRQLHDLKPLLDSASAFTGNRRRVHKKASCARELSCGRQARKPTFAMASVDALKKLRPVGELGKSANSTSGCTEAGHDSTSAARASIEDCLAKKDARASANLVLGAQSGPWRRALVSRVECSFQGH